MPNNFRKGHTTAAKLTPSQVLEIRLKFNEGRTQGSLCREYGVSVGQIGRITRGEAWTQYQQPENPSEFQHREAITYLVTPEEIAASERRLAELLASPPIPSHPGAENEPDPETVFARLQREVEKLPESSKERLLSELEEFLK